jgi:hypothetical protein
MSDPGTTYRSRDEVQAVRSERDAIAGLKKYILEWGATDEASLKVILLSPFTILTQCTILISQAIYKAAKEEVDVAVAEAKESPQPDLKDFWTDIYVSFSPVLLGQVLTKTVQGYRATLHAWTREGGGSPLLSVVVSRSLCSFFMHPVHQPLLIMTHSHTVAGAISSGHEQRPWQHQEGWITAPTVTDDDRYVFASCSSQSGQQATVAAGSA